MIMIRTRRPPRRARPLTLGLSVRLLALLVSGLILGGAMPGLAQEPGSETARSSARIEIGQTELDNGLRILVIPDPVASTLSAGLWIGAGRVHNPRGKEGLADLCAVTLRAWLRLALEEGRVGKPYLASEFWADVTIDHAGFVLSGLDDDLDTMLAALRVGVLTEADNVFLSASAIKQDAVLGLLAARTSQGLVAREAFAAALFGDRRPLGLSANFQTLLGILPNDVRQFHLDYYRPGNAILTLSGAIDLDTAREAAARHFADWEAGTPGTPAWGRAASNPAHPGVTLVDDPDAELAVIVGGFAGPGREEDDFAAIQLLHNLLGAGLVEKAIEPITGSRPEGHLFRSQLRASTRGSEITLEVGVPHELAAPTLVELRRTLRKLAESGIDADAFAEQIDAANSNRSFRFETTVARAEEAVALALAGRPIAAAEDPLAVFADLDHQTTDALWRELLAPGRTVWVVEGRGEVLAPELEAAGIEPLHTDVFEVITGRLFEPEPEHTPDPPLPYRTAASTALAEELLMAAIQAKGGFENLERVESYAVQESLYAMLGPEAIASGERQILARFPDRFREEMTMAPLQGRGVIQVVNGPSVWRNQLGKTRAATDEQRRDLMARMWLDDFRILHRYAEQGASLHLLDLAVIEGVTTDGFEIRSPDGKWVQIYLHPESRQVVRRLFQRTVDQRVSLVDERFTDYRAVEGVLVPFLTASFLDGHPTTQAIRHFVDVNLELPDQVFTLDE